MVNAAEADNDQSMLVLTILEKSKKRDQNFLKEL